MVRSPALNRIYRRFDARCHCCQYILHYLRCSSDRNAVCILRIISGIEPRQHNNQIHGISFFYRRRYRPYVLPTSLPTSVRSHYSVVAGECSSLSAAWDLHPSYRCVGSSLHLPQHGAQACYSKRNAQKV